MQQVRSIQIRTSSKAYLQTCLNTHLFANVLNVFARTRLQHTQHVFGCLKHFPVEAIRVTCESDGGERDDSRPQRLLHTHCMRYAHSPDQFQVVHCQPVCAELCGAMFLLLQRVLQPVAHGWQKRVGALGQSGCLTFIHELPKQLVSSEQDFHIPAQDTRKCCTDMF